MLRKDFTIPEQDTNLILLINGCKFEAGNF